MYISLFRSGNQPLHSGREGILFSSDVIPCMLEFSIIYIHIHRYGILGCLCDGFTVS